jgi:biotin carboxyl carrier protein
MKYTALAGGERLDIEFERTTPTSIRARIGDRSYDLDATEVEPGVYWFTLNDRSIEITVTPGPEGYAVSVGTHRIPVEILDARTALRKASQHGHEGLLEVRAPMPGKVVKLLVAEGDQVKANQGILVMEAMKMQNEIKSPKAGIMRKLSIAEGTAVSSGDLLAAVE